jgi:hypothetical protein
MGLARTLSHPRYLTGDPPLSVRCDGSTLLELATELASLRARKALFLRGGVPCTSWCRTAKGYSLRGLSCPK